MIYDGVFMNMGEIELVTEKAKCVVLREETHKLHTKKMSSYNILFKLEFKTSTSTRFNYKI